MTKTQNEDVLLLVDNNSTGIKKRIFQLVIMSIYLSYYHKNGWDKIFNKKRNAKRARVAQLARIRISTLLLKLHPSIKYWTTTAVGTRSVSDLSLDCHDISRNRLSFLISIQLCAVE
jgi:hypothetical protein